MRIGGFKIRIPTLGQATGIRGSAPSRAEQAARLNEAAGKAKLQQAIAYRTYLQGIEKQRAGAAKQAATAAQRANQLAKVANQEAKTIPPVAQAISYGGNRYSSTLAERPAVDVPYPTYPKFPDTPKYGKEPIGRMERSNATYFYMEPKDRFFEQEMADKKKWRDQIAATDKAYEKQMGQFNKGLEAFNKGVTAFQNEIKARAEAASRPVIPLIETGEATTQTAPSGRLRRGTGRGTLLAGNTGGFNPATGGNRLGGLRRSLLG